MSDHRSGMEFIIRTALTNFTVTLLIIGFIHTAVRLMRARRPLTGDVVVEALFVPYLLYSLAIACLYNFVMHVFFSEMVAGFIGWKPSPFQPEVGFASLGFGVVALLALRGDWSMRLAAVVAPSCFLLGAAAGHIVQMITAHNFAPGNAGSIFYTDIIVPLFGLTLVYLSRPSRSAVEA